MVNSAAGEKVFPRPAPEVRAAIATALRKLRWKVREGAGGAIAAVWTSPVFRFKDDVTVETEPAPGGTRVRVRSASRVGRYDFGQNARHVAELFCEIAETIDRDAFNP